MSEKEAKTKALEKHKKSAKCHCGKRKGHDGEHAKVQKVEYEKKGKVRDEQETKEEEEEEDAQ